MLSEIHEQPDVWTNLCNSTGEIDAVARLLTRRAPRVIMTVARGSSDHAALYGRYLAQIKLGLPTADVLPSVHTVWGRDAFPADGWLLAISQSGASPDIVSSVERARSAGSMTVAVTNDPSSDLARAAEVVLLLATGPERAIAATKSYTASLVVLRLLLGAMSGETATERAALGRRLASGFAETVAATVQDLPRWDALLSGAATAHVVARGPGLATAREAALKLTETCRITAQGWSAADILHGPMAAVGAHTPVLCLDPGERGRASVYAAAAAARQRGAPVVLVRAGIIDRGLADEDRVPVEVVPFQLLAHAVSTSRGLDPDQPQGLSKVTRTT